MVETISSVARLVASIVYNADRNIRDELFQEIITDENDYVSNLTREIRQEWRRYNLPCYLHAQKLNRQQENFFGCDSLFLIKIEKRAKLCLFEAKYPRIRSKLHYKWDSVQSSSGTSHFSHQLSRQSKWGHIAVIWELFILEEEPGKKFGQFDLWGSTCILHDPTLRYDHIERTPSKLWDNIQLEDLLKKVKRNYTFKKTNLFEILTSVLSCQAGARLPIQDGLVQISSADRTVEVRVPANLERMERDVQSFCEEYGVQHFWYLELNQDTRARTK